MFLRKLQWLGACLLALGATVVAPSTSRADISITVFEVDSVGAHVGGALGTFNSLPGQNSFAIAGVNTNVFNINLFGSTLFSNGAFGSLSSSFTLTISDTFNQASGHGLQFVVNATGAANNFPGQPGAFTNNAGASSAIAGTGGLNNIAGVNQVSASTTVQGVTTADSVDKRGDGSVNFPPAQTTNGNVANLPNPYSIIQTITVYALPVNGAAQIAKGANFAGNASSTVTANAAPVPGPGGLALALIALPVLGLRRALRKKSA